MGDFYEAIKKIEDAIELLKKDCIEVLLEGFVSKNEIPKNSEFIEEDNIYQDLKGDEWEKASFLGDIYVNYEGDIYMKFKVRG